MNELKFKRYSKSLNKYLKSYTDDVNILQIGCYNKEVTQIFLDFIDDKRNSHIICVDTFIRDIKYKDWVEDDD